MPPSDGISREHHPNDTVDVMPSAMREEIYQARQHGTLITVGTTHEEAHRNPDVIKGVREMLDHRTEIFNRHLAVVRRRHGAVGWLSLLPLTPSARRRRLKAIDKELEPYRAQLLYEQTQGWPWHQQRGCATALLTITAANDLSAPNSPGQYPTMSGPLDISILDFKFDSRCKQLEGLSLREAIIKTEQAFNKRNRQNAESYADHKLEKLQRFVTARCNADFKKIVVYCTDSLGIRSRGHEVAHMIEQHALRRATTEPRDTELLIVSFGCGTAWPILQVMKGLRDDHDIRSRVILLDQDPIALAAASQLAGDMGLDKNIELQCHRLFSVLGQPFDMRSLLNGRFIDVYEDSGLREYLPDRVYVALTRAAWQHLAPGGLKTTGNMNVNRPQPDFLDGLMGWIPHVRRRTIAHALKLHRKAGIPASATRVRVTQDGVYSLYFSVKPKDEH